MIRNLTVLPENKIGTLEKTSKEDIQKRLNDLASAISRMVVLPENKIGALDATSKNHIKNRVTAAGDVKVTNSSRIRSIPHNARAAAKIVAEKEDTGTDVNDVNDVKAGAPRKYVSRMETPVNLRITTEAREVQALKLRRERVRVKNLVDRPWLRDRTLTERPWLINLRKYL